MLAQFEANHPAVQSAERRFHKGRLLLFVSAAVTAFAVAGCSRPAVPLAGADPSDPAATAAGVGYRSTVAPYTSLRPTGPTSWREQNNRAAPSPQSGQ